MRADRNILVLGASGLIGRFLTDDLRVRGFRVVGVARHLSAAQARGADDLQLPVMSMDAAALAALLRDRAIDVVVNCLGVLQDGPGSAASDRTAFATTKREAERLIAASGVPYAILRPGIVVAPAAYGGSAMLRALAAFPIDLPASERTAAFQPVAVQDISATVAWLAARDVNEIAAVTWELMQPQAITLGGVIGHFRYTFGTQDWPRTTMPTFLLDLGARAGDLANWLGWMPPMRTTAIAELRRGVTGDPAPWMAATGIVPKTIDQLTGDRAATIQDKWFARLFLVKALMIASLVLFWLASGFIALVISFPATKTILSTHGFPPGLIAPFAAVTSLMDMSIGVLIAFRRSCAVGLVAGIVVSLGYMAGTALFTPDLWIEPLGALVKTGPAIVLMLVALLTLDNR